MNFEAIKVKEIVIQINFSCTVDYDLSRGKNHVRIDEIMTIEHFKQIALLVNCNNRHAPIEI